MRKYCTINMMVFSYNANWGSSTKISKFLVIVGFHYVFQISVTSSFKVKLTNKLLILLYRDLFLLFECNCQSVYKLVRVSVCLYIGVSVYLSGCVCIFAHVCGWYFAHTRKIHNSAEKNGRKKQVSYSYSLIYKRGGIK